MLSDLLSSSLVASLVNKLLKLSYKVNAELLVTTSRRTSGGVEDLLEEKLGQEDLCKLLVIANKNNIPNVVPAILNLCDIILVSGESISMVSEAASSNNDVMVFKPQKKPHFQIRKGHKGKHEKFLGGLHRKDYIELVEVEEIYKKGIEIINGKLKTGNLKIEEMLKESVSKVVD